MRLAVSLGGSSWSYRGVGCRREEGGEGMRTRSEDVAAALSAGRRLPSCNLGQLDRPLDRPTHPCRFNPFVSSSLHSEASCSTSQVCHTAPPLRTTADLLPDVQTLRTQHHICGILTGTLPQVGQQNVFLGLPMMLLPEEVVLLVKNSASHASQLLFSI